jgi:hypothetical protein
MRMDSAAYSRWLQARNAQSTPGVSVSANAVPAPPSLGERLLASAGGQVQRATLERPKRLARAQLEILRDKTVNENGVPNPPRLVAARR